ATVVRLTRRSGGKTEIVLDSGERLTWPSPVVTESSLVEGESIPREELDADLEEIARDLFPTKARKYLARYMRTSRQYVEHFTGKGYPERLVNSLLPVLEEEGYLDDRKVAEEHVRKRLESKPRGRRKLLAELQKKGIDRSLAREVVGEKVNSEKERQLAHRYGKKNNNLDSRKLASRLQSRGFPGHIIREVVDQYGKKPD
ncbi:MAG: regulatory protein RecX, partial [bacterium]